MITVGQHAEDFSILDHEEQPVSLKDFRGKWVVLYFYPKDNTSGCTIEANEFTSLMQDFNKLNAVVLGVSPDSCSSHRKFILKHGLLVKLLADPEKKALKLYDAWGEKKMYGKAFYGVIRSTVLIDPQGLVVSHWPKVKARGHALQVKEKLIELQAKGTHQ